MINKVILLISFFYASYAAIGQNVGIGTTTPNTKLDVAGAVTFEETILTAANGSNTLPSGYSQVKITHGTENTAFTLASPTSSNTGQVLTIYNTTSYTATFGTTAIPSSAAQGFIYSNSIWVPTSPASSGSGNYIQNQSSVSQSASFNISGSGEIGTTAIIGTGEGTGAVTGGTVRSPNPNPGSGNMAGPNLTINAGYGYGTGAGGNVNIIGGTTGTSGTNGSVNIYGGITSGVTSGTVNINSVSGSGNTFLNNSSGLVTVGSSTSGVSQLNVTNGLSIDNANANNGTLSNTNSTTTGNALVFGNTSGEGIASNRSNSTAGANQYGLDFYTATTKRLSITNAGVAILGSGDGGTPSGNSGTPGNTLRAPNAGSFNTPGGNLTLSAGYGTGTANGGSTYLVGGTTGTGSNGNSYIRGGYSNSAEGAVYLNDDHNGLTFINSGGGTAYVGGQLVMGTGDGTTSAAGTILRAPNAGTSASTGGALYMYGGNGYGGAAAGSIILTGGSSLGGTQGNAYLRGGNSGSAYGAAYINDLGGTIQLGTQTGIPYLTGGVLSIASAGTNYQAPITAGSGLYYSAANTLASYWTASGNNIYNNNNSGAGFVGIGTNGTPASILHVKTSGSTFETLDAGSGSQTGINFYVNGSGRTNLYFDPSSASYNSNGALLINNYGSNTPDVVMNLAGGKVGIGVATPVTALEVATFNTTNSNIKTGALELQSFALNNSWVGENTYYNSGYKYRAAGYATIMDMVGGAIDFRTAPSGAAAATAAMTSRMIILNNGYVGIGTSSPGCPLEVEATNNAGYGSLTASYNGSTLPTQHGYAYSNGAGSNNAGYPTGAGVAIYTSGRIFCSEVDAISDRRVKKDFSLTDSKDDIERLSKIEVTNFRYKDEIANGSNLKKGFIAQQVETVYPEAVTRQSGFIPDIYILSDAAHYDSIAHSLTISIDADHGLAAGDKVRLIAGQVRKDVTVSAVHPDCSFTVADWTVPVSQVFVYGREVHDFRAVDYDRIYTLNVSATQELARRLAAEQEELAAEQAKNKALEQKVSTLEHDTKADMDKMKASIETMQQIIGSKAQK